jgi:hypothetical protein
MSSVFLGDSGCGGWLELWMMVSPIWILPPAETVEFWMVFLLDGGWLGIDK